MNLTSNNASVFYGWSSKRCAFPAAMWTSGCVFPSTNIPKVILRPGAAVAAFGCCLVMTVCVPLANIKGESYRLREKLKAGLLKPKLDPLQPDGA